MNPAPLTLHLNELHLEHRLNDRTVHDGMALEVFDGRTWVWGLYSWVYEPHQNPKLLFRDPVWHRQNSLEIRADTPCRLPLEPDRLYA